jgi:hypothetical protein
VVEAQSAPSAARITATMPIPAHESSSFFTVSSLRMDWTHGSNGAEGPLGCER